MSDPAKYTLKLMKSVADLTDFHDVELVSGNDGQRFPAHRLILTASSKYFAALLGPNFREGKEKEVLLKEIDGSMLRAILDFVYTGDIEITADNVADIVAAASSMELIALEERCGDYWATVLTVENCVETYLNADKYHLKDLWSKALDYIAENFEAIPIDDFQQIDEKNFQALLKHDRITGDEKVVFDRLVQWMNHNKAGAVNVDSGLLEPIRLEHIPNAFLIKTIQPFFEKYECEKLVVNEFCSRLLTPKWLCLHRYAPEKIYCTFMNDSKDKINIQTYDFDRNQWMQFGEVSIGAAKEEFGKIFINGKLFVMGGSKGTDYFSSVESFTVETMWSYSINTLPSMRECRADFTPIYAGKYIYAIGGYGWRRSRYGHGRLEITRLNGVERFDTGRRVWESVSALPRDITKYAAIEFNGNIYVAADWTIYHQSFFYCYDPDRDVWSEKAIPAGDLAYPVLAKSKEFLYAVMSSEENCTIHKYDAIQNKWSKAGTLTEFGQIVGAVSHYSHIYVLCSEGKFEDLKIDDCFFRLNSKSFPSIKEAQLFSD